MINPNFIPTSQQPTHPMDNPQYFGSKSVTAQLFIAVLVQRLMSMFDPTKVANPALLANYLIGMIVNGDKSHYVSHTMALLHGALPTTPLYNEGDIVVVNKEKGPHIYKDGGYKFPTNYEVVEVDFIDMKLKLLSCAYPSSDSRASGWVSIEHIQPSEIDSLCWPTEQTIDLRKPSNDITIGSPIDSNGVDQNA